MARIYFDWDRAAIDCVYGAITIAVRHVSTCRPDPGPCNPLFHTHCTAAPDQKKNKGKNKMKSELKFYFIFNSPPAKIQ
jgi:hypothetical protein